MQSAHERGSLRMVGGLSDLRALLNKDRLSAVELADVKKALHGAAFHSQAILKDLQPDERLPFDAALASYEKRFGHLPVNFEVANPLRAWMNTTRPSPIQIKNNCVAVSGAMAVLLFALTGRADRIGFVPMPGHVMTTFRLNGVPHVVHAFGVQPLEQFKSDLVAAASEHHHPLRELAVNGGLHRIRPVKAYLDHYMTFAEGRQSSRLRKGSALFNRAYAHAISGNLAGAEKVAVDAFRASPESRRYLPLALLSRLYYHQNRIGPSLKAAEDSIRNNPLNPEAHRWRGMALRAQKHFGEAIRAFDASLAIRPDESVREHQEETWRQWTRESGFLKGVGVGLLQDWHGLKRRWATYFQRR